MCIIFPFYYFSPTVKHYSNLQLDVLLFNIYTTPLSPQLLLATHTVDYTYYTHNSYDIVACSWSFFTPSVELLKYFHSYYYNIISHHNVTRIPNTPTGSIPQINKISNTHFTSTYAHRLYLKKSVCVCVWLCAY